jgi:hypothetical protein
MPLDLSKLFSSLTGALVPAIKEIPARASIKGNKYENKYNNTRRLFRSSFKTRG